MKDVIASLLSWAPTIAFLVLGILFVAGDVHRISTMQTLFRVGDVASYWPPLWTAWVRVITVGAAVVAVIVVEIYMLRSSSD